MLTKKTIYVISDKEYTEILGIWDKNKFAVGVEDGIDYAKRISEGIRATNNSLHIAEIIGEDKVEDYINSISKHINNGSYIDNPDKIIYPVVNLTRVEFNKLN